MSGAGFTESVVEDAALAWFGELGYQVVFGPSIAPEEAGPEHPWHGVGLFKKGFGGRAVTWAGTWDVVADRTLYRLRATTERWRSALRQQSCELTAPTAALRCRSSTSSENRVRATHRGRCVSDTCWWP